jgi:hypothetical protein
MFDMKYAAPIMIAQRSGSIITIANGSSHETDRNP